MKKILISLFVISMLALIGCGGPDVDAFAQCLSDNDVKMYGAYWCPHCANQKSMFGSAFSHVTYVECSLPERAGMTEICIKEKIKLYPTWEFADSSRLETVQDLETLGEKSGCVLE